MKITCFKAYDIRGKLGTELSTETVYRIGRAYARWLKPGNVVVGGDIRTSSPALKSALANGLRDEGVDVLDIGLCGTEEIYFATAHLKAGGGIMVTASHNPIDYNGMKMVREGSRPISADSGLKDIQLLAEEAEFLPVIPDQRGSYRRVSCSDDYIEHLLSYVDLGKFRPLKIVVNAGNGAAGPVLDALESHLPFEFIKVNHEPDGTFPNGIPNPLLPESRHHTSDIVKATGADLGLAWDGDFDRCFLFDEKGEFIEGYYIVGLLAEAFLRKHPGEKIIHDPRLTWNTQAICEEFGGRAIQSKCGHAFIKQAMREENAVYGGEMSAHHYFRDFFYCDSGMIPWLLIAELISTAGQPLSEMIHERMAAYPCSGEINRSIADAPALMTVLRDRYIAAADSIEQVDGLSMAFEAWRFNLRSSNTEPVVRLNVEATNRALMEEKTSELLALLGGG
ncbi:MAG: phosphomannomutase CpsG [Gammaproteobacteria bacterium]|nr:MAG: phosphomannomutase CpsG [Gammaproteobacteria bacterium]